MTQATSHRQLLMRCEVRNPRGIRSTRYVEHAVFPLWTYLLENRHGLSIQNAKPCMWVPQDQWRRNDRLFAKAGKNESVARMTFRATPADNGVREARVRYVPDRDFDEVVEVLIPHLKKSLSDELEWDIEIGGAVAAG